MKHSRAASRRLNPPFWQIIWSRSRDRARTCSGLNPVSISHRLTGAAGVDPGGCIARLLTEPLTVALQAPVVVHGRRVVLADPARLGLVADAAHPTGWAGAAVLPPLDHSILRAHHPHQAPGPPRCRRCRGLGVGVFLEGEACAVIQGELAAPRRPAVPVCGMPALADRLVIIHPVRDVLRHHGCSGGPHGH
jgi:hypothetical protein